MDAISERSETVNGVPRYSDRPATATPRREQLRSVMRWAGSGPVPADYARSGVKMAGFGYYHDVYIRVGGEWRFRSRKLVLREYVPVPGGSAEGKAAG